MSRKWRVDRDLSLTPAERQALQREWATAKQRRAEERDRSEPAASKDAAAMCAADTPARADHAYYVKKGLSPHHLLQSAAKVLVQLLCGAVHVRRIDTARSRERRDSDM